MKMFSTEMKINEPDDIARLPWRGNFADDAALFEFCDDYIRSEPELAKRQRASELASLHGCGEECTCPADYDPLTEVGEKSPLTEEALRYIGG